jgi:hypothetical protein
VLRAAIEANQQVALAIEPREGAFDDPAVAAEARFRFDPAARNPRLDPALAARAPALPVIVGLVGFQKRTAPRLSSFSALAPIKNSPESLTRCSRHAEPQATAPLGRHAAETRFRASTGRRRVSLCDSLARTAVGLTSHSSSMSRSLINSQ